MKIEGRLLKPTLYFLTIVFCNEGASKWKVDARHVASGIIRYYSLESFSVLYCNSLSTSNKYLSL